MLNSKKLKEISKVLDKKSIMFLGTRLEVQGHVNNTKKDINLSPIWEIKKEYIADEKYFTCDTKMKYGNNKFVEYYQTHVDFSFTEREKHELESSLMYLENNLNSFENLYLNELRSVLENVFGGNMTLEAEFKVDGIGKVSNELGDMLKEIGYNKTYRDLSLYTLAKDNYVITISFDEDNVKISVWYGTHYRYEIKQYFKEAKELIISLYNKSIKKIKE